MRNSITKLIKSFENPLKKSIFASKIRDKCVLAYNSLEAQRVKTEKWLHPHVCKAVVRYRRVYKYMGGRTRLRMFLITSIRKFDTHHAELFSIIESGNLLDDKKRKERYEACKQDIGILLRANRRMTRQRIVSKRMVTSYLNQHLHQKRMEKKYVLAT